MKPFPALRLPGSDAQALQATNSLSHPRAGPSLSSFRPVIVTIRP